MPANIQIIFEGPITDPTTGSRITNRALEHMGSLMETILMPKMRARIPVDTGDLKRSLTMIVKSNYIDIGFPTEGFYYLYQRGLPASLIKIWEEGIRELAPIAFRRAISEILV